MAVRSHIQQLFKAVPADSLAFFRVCFGFVLVWEVLRYFQYHWIDNYYIQPEFYFKYFGFEWVQPWADESMYLHFAALGVVAACVAMGLFYRFAALLLVPLFAYIFLLDQTRYLNHFYLVILLSMLMVLLPAHRDWSFDSAGKPLAERTVPNWAVWLLRAQLGLVYFYAGVAKLNADWLGGEPVRMWMAERTHFPYVGSWIDSEAMVYIMSYGGLWLDLFAFPLLLWKRTRLPMFLLCVFFHSSNKFLFNIGIFPYLMLAGTTIFFAPDWPRKLVDWALAKDLRRQVEGDKLNGPLASMELQTSAAQTPAPQDLQENTGPELPIKGAPTPSGAVLLGFIALWFALQILIPLRHFTYPGLVHWTEEGHRFAWHMKLRSKGGRATFRVVDPVSGRAWKVDPNSYLEPKQARKMATRPDMLLQFVHYLEEQWRQDYELADVEIYADCKCSLNGRRRVPLIDPERDLSKEARNLKHADWILPLNEPLRPPLDTTNLKRLEPASGSELPDQ